MKKLKAILILLLLSSSTAFGQGSGSNDSIRCFGITQQREILKKFVELDECRDMRKADSSQMAKLDTALVRMFDISTELYAKVDEQHATIDTLDKKVRNRNKFLVGSISVNLLFISLLILF
jgi:hypothetical protein